MLLSNLQGAPLCYHPVLLLRTPYSPTWAASMQGILALAVLRSSSRLREDTHRQVKGRCQ